MLRSWRDNATTQSIINQMGTSDSPKLNNLTKDIWDWCIEIISGSLWPVYQGVRMLMQTENRARFGNLVNGV